MRSGPESSVDDRTLPSESSSTERRPETVRFRDPASAALMVLPLAFTMFVAVRFASDLSRRFEVFLDIESGASRTAPGLVMLLVALIPSLVAAVVGFLGTFPRWQVNRRMQRAVLGSLAAACSSVFAGTLALTLARANGDVPDYGAAMFGTICALAYGGLCAAVSPPDRVDDLEEDLSWTAE